MLSLNADVRVAALDASHVLWHAICCEFDSLLQERHGEVGTRRVLAARIEPNTSAYVTCTLVKAARFWSSIANTRARSEGLPKTYILQLRNLSEYQ